jgi:hypothetical protein
VATAPPAGPPIAGYHFDETSGTTANDFTGNGNNAVVEGVDGGSASWVTGEINGALHLDGVSTYVQLPTTILDGVGDFTIATWVNLDTNKNWSQLWDFGQDTGQYIVLIPQNGANGLLRFEFKTSTPTFDLTIDAPSVLAVSSWQHVAVVHAGETASLYVNGSLQAFTATIPAASGFGDGWTNNWIGRSEWGDPLVTGAVDEFLIYNQALTAAEVAALAKP